MFSRFSVKKPYTVLVAIVLVIVLGIVSLTRMTADLLPSMNMPYAIVMTTYPGASPEEVELGVTKPIESAMATTSNIKHISSTSSDNMSMVILEFEQTANMDSVTIEMRESLDQISGYFPDSVGNPIIMKINPDMMPIMIAAADMDGMDEMEISRYVESFLIPELESIEGVASATAVGTVEETVDVVLDQEKIDKVNEDIKASLDLSFADAQEEMEKAQEEMDSGRNELESGQEQLASQVSGATAQLNDQKMELLLAEQQMNTQLEELRRTQIQLEQGIAGLNQLSDGAAQLAAAIAQLKEGIAAAEAMTPEQQQEAGIDLAAMQAQLAELEAQYAALEQQLAGMGAQLGQEGLTFETLPTAITTLVQKQAQVSAGIMQIEQGLVSIAEGKTTVNDTLAQLSRSQILGASAWLPKR